MGNCRDSKEIKICFKNSGKGEGGHRPKKNGDVLGPEMSQACEIIIIICCVTILFDIKLCH